MRRAVSAWVAGLAVIVLAGCTDPGQPSTTLPPLASSTAAATPTLAPLGPADFPVPDAARVQTLDGAIAMATYYFGLVGAAQAERSSEWLRAVSVNCTTCDTIADRLEADVAAGNALQGGDLTVSSIGGELDGDVTANLAYVVDQTAFQVNGPDGVVLAERESPAGSLTGGGYLTWDPARSVWLTAQIELERQ